MKQDKEKAYFFPVTVTAPTRMELLDIEYRVCRGNLKVAEMQEDYERAAELRDRMKEIEKTLKDE